jgi:hypothetical protein
MKQIFRQFPPLFTISLHSTWAASVARTMSIRFLNALKLTHAHSFALDRASILREMLTVPLSCGETRTLLALFILSIKMFKMCTLIQGHLVLCSPSQSVLLYTWIISRTAGWIFMKFSIGGLRDKLSSHFNFNSDRTAITYNLHVFLWTC